MIGIDSDTHFTPLDAFADLDSQYAGQVPRVVALPSGGFRIDYPAHATRRPRTASTILHFVESGRLDAAGRGQTDRQLTPDDRQ